MKEICIGILIGIIVFNLVYVNVGQWQKKGATAWISN